MTVYAKRRVMFMRFLVAIALVIIMVLLLNNGFREITDYGGLQLPIYGTPRLSNDFSWIFWLFCLGGEGYIIYLCIGFVKFWARSTPAIMMTIDDSGICVPELASGQYIPWADIESYNMDSRGGLPPYTWLTLKIKNREHYQKKKWWGLFPAMKIKILGFTESPNSISQCLDKYLQKYKQPL